MKTNQPLTFNQEKDYGVAVNLAPNAFDYMINKKITRLHKLALKAAVARDEFEQALAKAQRERNWVDICIAEGIDPQANAGDWMC